MKRLDVAMIGAGFIARTHLPVWIALGARVRVFSTDGQAARLAEEFGITEAATLEEALEWATVVDICTPAATHRDIALAAFEAGAEVLCEKPLALAPADALEMTYAAEKAGRQIYPGHVVRFFPAYVRLRDAINSGALGRVAVARFARTGSCPRWSSWFADPALSGGILTDQMLHDMDIARWLFGEVVTIHATQRDHLTTPAPEGAWPSAVQRSPTVPGSSPRSWASGHRRPRRSATPSMSPVPTEHSPTTPSATPRCASSAKQMRKPTAHPAATSAKTRSPLRSASSRPRSRAAPPPCQRIGWCCSRPYRRCRAPVRSDRPGR